MFAMKSEVVGRPSVVSDDPFESVEKFGKDGSLQFN
jgi:hypothetical protein